MKTRSLIMIFFFSIFLIVFAVTTDSFARQKESLVQTSGSQEAVRQWEAFKKIHPKSEIEWDKKTGVPRTLKNFVTKAYPGNAERRAKAFLKEYYVLFGVKKDLADLKIVKTSKTAIRGKTGIDYVTFQQFYDNVPIIGTETILHITETGKVFRVYNRYYPVITIANKKEISKQTAIDIARDKLKKKKLLSAEGTATLTIYQKKDKFFYAWQVQVDTWRYYIDAETGDVLFSQETILFQCTGQVYEKNVCDTPTRIVGSLPNLDTSGYLRGTYFDVQPLTGTRAQSNTCVYNYPVNDGKFDQTEVYYQCERARSYFKNLGFQPNPVQTPAYTEHWLYPCNAGYNWGSNYFLFGPASEAGCAGTPCYSPAQDGDIIFHEYAHQVIHQTSNIDATQHWPQSIHEAVADYFAASFFSDSCLAETIDKDCGTCLRNVVNNKKLPGDANWSDPHLMGLILSGALWDIRGDLGQSFTDWVAYEALKGLPSDADFTDYATNALDVVAAKIDDIDNWVVKLILIMAQITMRDRFCARGITLSTPYACP